MKKLLIMTGVAAFALGAFATITLPYGTGFDENTTFPPDAYWGIPQTEWQGAVTAWGGEAQPSCGRPEFFSGKQQANYFSLESAPAEDALVRYIGTNPAEDYQPIGNGLYLDTLVKFTASTETMGTSDTAAKLAIWAQTSDENLETTNFVVQAGYVTADSVTSTNYVMTTPADDFDFTAWHRLTVKAISNIGGGRVGFVVFVDGTALERADGAAIADKGALELNTVASQFADAVLPSIIHTGDYKTTLQAVSFSGTGGIDDISFTDVAPQFAADATVYTVTWGEGIASVSHNDTDLVKDAKNTLPEGSFALVVTLESGYALGTPVASGCTVTANGNTFTVSGATPGASIEFTAFQPKASVVVGNVTTYYDSLTDAFADAKTTGGTITLSDTAVLTKALSLQSETEVTIDLNGQTITGAAGQPVFTIEAGSLVIRDSATGGAVNAGANGMVLAIGGGLTKVYGGKFTGAFAFDADGEVKDALEIYGGKFDAASWTGDDLDFELSDVANAEVAVTGPTDGYYTVGGKPTTYKVTFSYTVPGAESATVSSVDVEDGTLLSTLTWPELPSVSGYTAAWPTYAEGASVTADVTYTATYSANTYTVTFYTNSVEYVKATYTYGDATSYTAPADPVVDGFTFGGWFTDDGTFKTEFVFSAGVVGNTQVAYAKLTEKQTPEDDYPRYIPTEDTAAKAKYDSWATYAGVTTAAAAEELEAAYLLNCKPDEVAAAKAAFKFTSIYKDGDKWVTPTTTSYNDREYNGTVTVESYSDVECKTKSETGTFFRATLQ